MRLLTTGRATFWRKSRKVLRAGRETAEWVTVDDTGVRHRGANAVRTRIGNDSFAPAFAARRRRSAVEPVGRDCRDAFLGLANTCRKLGVAF